MKTKHVLSFVSMATIVTGLATACDRQAPTPATAAGADKLAGQKQAFADYVERLPPLTLYDPDRQFDLVLEYLEDPALPTLDAARLDALLGRTERYAREYLKIKVRLRLRQKGDVAAFFKARAADFEHPVLSYPAHAWHIDLNAPEADAQIRTAIADAIKDRPEDLLEEYFGPIPDGRDEYIARIQTGFMAKLRAIHAERDATGKPLYDPARNPARSQQISFAYWDSLLYQEKDVDFYLTNTIMAAPDTGMPLYVISRGGVTSGFVENNEHRPYRGVGLVALYPILSSGDFFRSVRGEYSEEDKLDAAAFIILHELGHLLLRKSENYTLVGSIHRAPVDLDYRAWMRAAKAGHKKLDGSKIETLQKF